ncbi:hypothetical protein PtA15_5A253 [Puccinia triticina]|uniref:SYO1-like TPR repeats domain-containing protein n=1 Tax=Puccinia triticina TaxID=208348 RepID=A0ABY7CLJ5_9BASI|nr:uncharacterized protein PtA15_5A253 [Puccinia triticina]WAQ84680.1 hypothetical protein PtA15_5A253 [Puccinia triticina]WAR58025.1 hypothetical protein PtB15_5B256 [Puccinia triticina]
MGKAQYKRRIRSARHHANGAPITHEDQPKPFSPASPEVVSKSKAKKSKNQNQQSERQATIAVLDKISSPSSHDRIWSLAAISNLVLSSASTRQLFLSKNLIRLLINRLTEDADQEDVLVEVTGVLRNLVIEGGRDVCGEMANKGILQPLNILVSKLLASIANFQDTNPSDAPSTPAQSLIWSRLILISENVVITLWSLAETSSKWLDSVIALQDIIPLLTNILRLFTDHLDTRQAAKPTRSNHVVPSSCALASGQCLYALTEDHPKLSKRLAFSDELSVEPLITLSNTPDQPSKQFSAEDNENLELLKVVSIGILRNIILHTRKRAEELPFKSEYDEKMPHILIAKLRVDLRQLAEETAEAHNSIPTAPLSDLNFTKASIQGPSPAELKLESIERRLTLVQLALELVGEWCASADGFDDDIGSSNGSDADEDEMDNSNDGSEHPEEEQGSQSQTEDVDMEEIPTVSEHISGSKANRVKSDRHSTEDQNNAMDIEESEPFVQSPQSTPFSHLLSHLNNLAKPTPYFYQSRESEPMGKNIIPTAISTERMPSNPTGTVPDLICELLSGIHLRATDALNNMMITIDRLEGTATHTEKTFASTNQESLFEVWKSCWSTTAELAHHAHLSRKGKQKAPNGSIPSQQCHREQLLTSALTCFWSLSRVLLTLSAANSPSTLPVTPDQTKCLVELLGTSESETIKARALTTLICLASRPKVSVEENAVVGDVLIDIISKASLPGSDVPNSLLIGALDGMFDVYADETREYDEPVFRQRGFLDTIKAALPMVQAIVKKIDKRKDPALRQQAEEVQSNLSAFIDYRKSLT